MKNNLVIGLLIFILVTASIIPVVLSGTQDILGFFDPQQPSGAPVFSNPNPANRSTDVSVSTTIWNITIRDPEGNTFNWTIQLDNGNSSSGNDETNGSKICNVNLTYSHNYTVYVNATDIASGNWTNETFWFVTEDEFVITWTTLSFSGTVYVQNENPVLSNEFPVNETLDAEMYTWLNITVMEPQGQHFNITWLTNESGSWEVFAYNSSVTNDTYRQRPNWTNASDTSYWWQVHANDTDQNWANETYWFTTDTYTWGDWSSWWQFNFSSESPTDFIAETWNGTQINLSWTKGTGSDNTTVLRNATGWSHYPNTPTNGTVVYNASGVSYDDDGLSNCTTYYYTAWGWNETNQNHSLGNTTAYNTTDCAFDICCPYPPHGSTEITRPPVNLSFDLNGTDIDIYWHWYNHTPKSEFRGWENWLGTPGVSTGRIVYSNFDFPQTSCWIWGNTTYYWAVNATDGIDWINHSYNYTTKEQVTDKPKNARMDVNNDGASINTADLSTCWGKRTLGGYATYDGLYDVNDDDKVDTADLSVIWGQRTLG